MISIPLAVILILFGIGCFAVPFRYGVITRRFKAIIDNSIFRLHYRLTFGFLLSFTVFLAATTLIEEPLDQITDGTRVWSLMSTSCKVHNEMNFSDVAIGNTFEYSHGLNETIYERKPGLMYYYQVMTLSLLVQAILCILPYKLWTLWENTVTQTMLNIYHSVDQKTENGIISGRERLINHLMTIFNFIPDSWFYSLVMAEVMNFFNVVTQLFLVFSMFSNDSSGLEIPLFRANLSNWEVECNHVTDFPGTGLKTKCFFEREFGPEDMRQYVAICKFPRTVIDEKFYLFLTFWLLYIAALSGGVLICRFLIIISPRIRCFWTRSRVRFSHPDCYRFIFRKSSIADWFLFEMLCKNLEPADFNDVVNDFAKKLEGKKFAKPIDNYI